MLNRRFSNVLSKVKNEFEHRKFKKDFSDLKKELECLKEKDKFNSRNFIKNEMKKEILEHYSN